MGKTRFANGERMALNRTPTLIVHGKNDVLISSKQSERLYDICQARKLLVLAREMDHNTNVLQHVGFFVLPMLQFFQLPDYSFEDLLIPHWAFVVSPAVLDDSIVHIHHKNDMRPPSPEVYMKPNPTATKCPN